MSKELFQHFLLRFLNIPYRWGGDDPMKGYDCSGFVQDALAAIGMDPAGDQTAQALHDYFDKLHRPGLSASTGSLSFYGKDFNSIIHIAIHLDGQTVIEAGGGGSRTNSAEDAANQNAFIRLRPYKYRKDYLTTLTPRNIPWLAP